MPAETIRIHAAPWVVPVGAPVLRDGGVAVAAGVIVAVDVMARLQQQYPGAEVRNYPGCVLTPALVNAHTHLELSHLAGLASEPHTGSFTDWITRLLALREHLGADGEAAETAARSALEGQYSSGVQVIADIGNTSLGRDLAATFPGLMLAYKEYLGLAEFTLAKNLQRLAQEPAQALCTGHAPYSTHPALLRQLKARANSHGQIFPLHVAEPAAEAEMLACGSGELVDFVRRRGFWDDSFRPTNSGGSIHALHELGLLDARTLCVHAIHVNDAEIQMMADLHVKVCLCPGSNRFLLTGRAPARRYLEHGILPALGTDSLASNPEISLWREMRILAEDQPDLAPADIFTMATRGGAEALGIGHRFGSLAPGRKAAILAVPLAGNCRTETDIHRYLVRTGSTLQPERIAT